MTEDEANSNWQHLYSTTEVEPQTAAAIPGDEPALYRHWSSWTALSPQAATRFRRSETAPLPSTSPIPPPRRVTASALPPSLVLGGEIHPHSRSVWLEPTTSDGLTSTDADEDFTSCGENSPIISHRLRHPLSNRLDSHRHSEHTEQHHLFSQTQHRNSDPSRYHHFPPITPVLEDHVADANSRPWSDRIHSIASPPQPWRRGVSSSATLSVANEGSPTTPSVANEGSPMTLGNEPRGAAVSAASEGSFWRQFQPWTSMSLAVTESELPRKYGSSLTSGDSDFPIFDTNILPFDEVGPPTQKASTEHSLVELTPLSREFVSAGTRTAADTCSTFVLGSVSTVALGFGVGILLVQSLAAHPAVTRGFFTASQWTIVRVYLSAVCVSMLGQALMSRVQSEHFKQSRMVSIDEDYPQSKARVAVGCLLSGSGMALSGSSTLLLPAQLGALVLPAYCTLFGAVLGGLLFEIGRFSYQFFDNAVGRTAAFGTPSAPEDDVDANDVLLGSDGSNAPRRGSAAATYAATHVFRGITRARLSLDAMAREASSGGGLCNYVRDTKSSFIDESPYWAKRGGTAGERYFRAAFPPVVVFLIVFVASELRLLPFMRPWKFDLPTSVPPGTW